MMTSDATNAANAVNESRPVGSDTPASSTANALGRLTARNRGTNFRDVFIAGRVFAAAVPREMRSHKLRICSGFSQFFVWRDIAACVLCGKNISHEWDGLSKRSVSSGDLPNERPRITRMGANFGGENERTLAGDGWVRLSPRTERRRTQGVRSRSSGGATAVVRQLKTIVRTRKTNVTAIAINAAGVASRSRCTLKNTNVTAPATAVST
jgi:hypothetical protein